MEENDKMLQELQERLNRQMEQINAAPLEELDGLSPNEMSYILYRPFAEGSPLRFKDSLNNEIVAQIPFYKLFREYLGKIKEAGQVKLTSKGNLPRKICQELYATAILPEEFIEKGIVKLRGEDDSIVIKNLKILGNISKVTKKRNNKISLTKQGEQLYHDPDQTPLFKLLFETNMTKFNLGYHDAYPQQTAVQMVIGYTLYLLLQYGKTKRNLHFYVDKNLQAFPQLLADFGSTRSTPERQYKGCYQVRVFDRFLAHYGLVETEETINPDSIDSNVQLLATDTFREVFEFKKGDSKFRKT